MRSRRSGTGWLGRGRPVRIAAALVVLVTALAPATFAAPVAAGPSVTVDHEGDRVTVANGTAQVVRGTADAPVGTEILVRVRSTDGTDPAFLKAERGVVTENGTWAVAFDFAHQSAGDGFRLTAQTENGSAEIEVDGEVVACEGDCAETPPSDTPTPIPEQTATPTRTAGPDAPVTFGENVFLADTGGVTAVPVTFDGGDTDRAVVVVGDAAEVNYELEAVVTDGDGDGEAILYVDTSLAGRGGDTVSTSGGDSVTIRSETPLEGTLDPATYDVALYAGGEGTDAPADVGSLVVQAAATPTVATDAPTNEPADAGGDGPGSVAVGALVSGAFLLGGAVLAAVLLEW
ncbi:BGTF surface domain-containing protein [Halobellus ruber]|uniref:DUF7827 domain-containing protein n=1 Tax=Halobellus ruber TaxID=2761102 RepID=A0A7J9SJ35_9EURY|nr:BGTF surface domain-containing protein [Halobellus ruber]MBB6646728.1 hypothetical protein [Halobellus ruber]